MSDDAAIESIVPAVEQYVGAPGVSTGEIEGVLSQAGQALDMVRGSSFGKNLTNIAYIYNSSESGAFGIFDPNIDRSVKVKVVQKKLRDMGYETDIKEGSLYAWKSGATPEEVAGQMKEMYRDLDMKGGMVIGINAKNILDVSRRNFEDLKRQIVEAQAAGQEVTPADQSDLDALIALHLGSTIVHETVHALGEEGEAGPVEAQRAWTAEVLPQINSARAAQGRVSLEMGEEIYKARSFREFVKQAQVAYQEYVLPEVFLRLNYWEDEKHFPVEGEPHDSLETLLEKNRHCPVPANFILERQLGKDRGDPLTPRMIMEDLLDEERPHPIILPLEKSAGINSNVGGPFISSPFSIDELLPRVFDGRDIQDRIDYKEGEQPYWHMRYNPQNVHWDRDRFGRLTYQYDERYRYVNYCNNWAAGWNELFREDGFTSPWQKMASSTDEAKNDVLSLLRSIGYYKELVRDGRRNAVRFVCSKELLPMIERAAADMGVQIFDHGDECSVWIRDPDVSDKKIAWLEKSITAGVDLEAVNDFMGTADEIRDRINSIFRRARIVAEEHGIAEVYAVGGFPRMLAGTRDFLEVNDLDMTSPHPTDCLKLGGLLASEVNADDVAIFHRTMTLSFSHLGIKMDFRGNFVPYDARPLMREVGIPTTALNFDVYARDFTVNGLLYDFLENKIYDVTGRGIPDIKSRLIRTFFDPDVVLHANPLVVTRAIVMNLRGWEIDEMLYEAMKRHASCIFDGGVSEVRLAYEYDKVAKYDDGDFMLKEFGLEKLKEIRKKAERENPELFEE